MKYKVNKLNKIGDILQVASKIEIFFLVVCALEEPPLLVLLFFEAIITSIYNYAVFPKLSVILNESKKDNIKSILISSRILILFASLFITPVLIIIDILAVIPSAILVSVINKLNVRLNLWSTDKNVFIKCEICGEQLAPSNKFCTKCGAELNNPYAAALEKSIVGYASFDPMYKKNEDDLLNTFIVQELDKAKLPINTKLIPSSIIRQKEFLDILFAILIFVYVSLIFFHFPIYTYIIGAIILLILMRATVKYKLVDYIKKEVLSRPGEKISNIVMTVKNSLQEEKKSNRIIYSVIAAVLSLLLFITPHIMYEKNDEGYGVRFYTFGLFNFTSAEIPSTYKGEDVTSLRGNTFSNMPFLKEVELPDTIKEIRGQAFKNDSRLRKVNIPSNLEYLGGGSFKNCKSIKKIELPDTLTYLGGESFQNAKSLKEVKLSENLTEIRGNTFEECKSLKSITIPDKVERIGGHAFYGNSSLEEVIITENSSLTEIGSSAFRLCPKLTTINIPVTADVNSRAFKESPTKIVRIGKGTNTKYEYSSFMYLSFIGDVEAVEKYSEASANYNSTITFVSAEQISDSYQFTFKYTNGTEEITFILDKDNMSKEINENITVVIDSEYEFDYFTSGVSLNTYYN